MAETHHVGQRMSYAGALCTIRYVGDVTGTTGSWLGVEWDDASRGKHDGSHKGVRYFHCRSSSPTAASLIRPSRPADQPQSFVAALKEKYAPENAEQDDGAPKQIVFSSKVAEEMGFDKIRRKLAQVRELKIVILDGMRIDRAHGEGDSRIGDICPSVTQLDLSRNMFHDMDAVLQICSELPNLRTLRLNGNRFQNVPHELRPEDCQSAFSGLTDIELEDTLLDWQKICSIASACPNLTTLLAGSNQLIKIPKVNLKSLTSTLTSLNLEFNEFTCLQDLQNLAALERLRNLHLKGNRITELGSSGSHMPQFSASLQYLDVSYNNIGNWDFVDSLPSCIPGLIALRIAHNPFYDIKDDESQTSSSEEAHLITIARLAPIKSLNFSSISGDDRTNAEMFYLSRIAKQLALVPESAEDTVTSTHPRYRELCGVYGEPDVIRREEINPSFLDARLIAATFQVAQGTKFTIRIPKSFDMYAVKGIVGRKFDMSPLSLRLIWETGEWDPVGNFDDGEQGSSDEETGDIRSTGGDTSPSAQDHDNSKGRWIKREVELTDGPRQLGYVVDGSVASIRVEEVKL